MTHVIRVPDIIPSVGNIESSRNLSEIRSAVSEIKATEDAIKHFIGLGGNRNLKEASNKMLTETEDELLVNNEKEFAAQNGSIKNDYIQQDHKDDKK